MLSTESRRMRSSSTDNCFSLAGAITGLLAFMRNTPFLWLFCHCSITTGFARATLKLVSVGYVALDLFASIILRLLINSHCDFAHSLSETSSTTRHNE